MQENELVKEFYDGFNKLSEENKKYVLAISQALLFSQTTAKESASKTEEERGKQNKL